MKRPQTHLTIPIYQILIRVIIIIEVLLLADFVVETALVFSYFQQEITIAALSLTTWWMLIIRFALIFWAYNTKGNKIAIYMGTKTILAVLILILSSFKVLSIADLEEDTHLNLLFTNVIVLNLSWVFMEVFTYYVVFKKVIYTKKSKRNNPRKQESKVHTKKNSGFTNNKARYQELPGITNSSKEKGVLDELKPKKVL